jgi:(p)ppGpp synthase/HD superfamily hydrolase
MTDRLAEAFAYANELHATQVRKGSNSPYVAHLMGVASLVLEAGGDEDLAIAGLLHDAVEDQGGLPVLEEIRKRFGDRVASVVEGCTDATVVPKPPWRERKEAYLAHLPEASEDVRTVSCADKLYNARSILMDYRAIGDDLWDRFRGKKEGTLWYYRSLLEAFRTAGAPDLLLDELGRVVTEVHHLAGEDMDKA